LKRYIRYKTKNLNLTAIITPFRNLAELFRERIALEKLPNVDIGTVHTFQGDERGIINTAITHKSSPKTFDWIKNNERVLNVATTEQSKS
jgi:superfamily I DNA and/or RNA helicase